MHLSADDQRMLVQRTGRPMATDVSVQISTVKDRVEDAEHAADACMRWFEEVDLRLSRFRPESELCALNRSAGRWFAASPALYAVVGVALQSSRASSGRFDPTLLPQIEALGYDRDFALIGQRETDVVGSSVPSTPPPVSPGQVARHRTRSGQPAYSLTGRCETGSGGHCQGVVGGCGAQSLLPLVCWSTCKCWR